MLIQIEDDNGKVIVFAQTDGGRIHYLQPQIQHIHIGDVGELLGVLYLHGVGVVDTVDLGRFENCVGFDFHGAQRRRRVGRKVRIARAAREDHDAAFLQMPDGAPPDERLGHLIHFDGSLHACIDFLLLERILQRQRVDDRGQHTHVIGGNAVHVTRLVGHAAEKIAAADYDRDLHAQFVNVRQLGGDLVDASGIDTKALMGSQSFSGKLE